MNSFKNSKVSVKEHNIFNTHYYKYELEAIECDTIKRFSLRQLGFSSGIS